MQIWILARNRILKFLNRFHGEGFLTGKTGLRLSEMEDRHITILREHWSDIRNLEPRNILPKLVRVLIETDYEEINQEQSTRRERCDKLLDILIRRGKNAFDVFVCALDKEAPHLALKLIDAGNIGGTKSIIGSHGSIYQLSGIRKN